MKTFLLCPGSERSGTTWLYKYLNNFNNINFGDTKEYHYFDSINIPEFNQYVKINKKHDVLYKFYENENYYYNYFNNILQQHSITGDFSPGYSELNKNILLNIKQKFELLNINTKIIYLIRDPISRHISATNLRIQYDYLNLNNDKYNEIILSNLNDPIFKIHAKYEESHDKFLNIFGHNYKIQKYETLFNKKSMFNLCNFLNIEYLDTDFKIKVHSKHIDNIKVYDSTKQLLLEHYQNEINFLNQID